MGMTGKSLRDRRVAAGLTQGEVAEYLFEANGSGRRLEATILSRIENRVIRMPRGFVAEYLHAVEVARQRKADAG